MVHCRLLVGNVMPPQGYVMYASHLNGVVIYRQCQNIGSHAIRVRSYWAYGPAPGDFSGWYY